MRMAVLSDIHGNSIALDAVLADIQAQGGADMHLVLGDLVAVGVDPIGVLERITRLPDVRVVQGNTDRYVVTGERPYPTIDDVVADPSLAPRLVEVAHTFAWTQGALSTGGWLAWLESLPDELQSTLPDGSQMLAVHVAPGMLDGPGVHPRLSDAELGQLIGPATAELICVGHTHWPVDRRLGRQRVINPGSVSNPLALELRASYALIHASEEGFNVELRRVAYDVDAVVDAIIRSRHPSRDYILSHFRRERYPWWAGGTDGREHILATAAGD
jgi:putative phosphoesterase